MNRRQLLLGLAGGLTGVSGCFTGGSQRSSPSPTPTGTQSSPTKTNTPQGTESPEPTASPEPTPARTMTNTATLKFETPESGEPFVINPPEAYKTVDIGSRENVENPGRQKGNAVYIFRQPEEAATFEVQIADLETNTVLVHQIYRVPTDGSLKFDFHEKSHYALNLYDFKYEFGRSLDNQEVFFDCNGRYHTLFSHSNGEYNWNTTATRRDCD
ncbi:hypothetical protein [Natronomonas marina]|jgi:hypothetical protein|uniref:hypothetical protein n=1 Tax=Natronomonas marina TaxID=2961939 RepID=UPI0020C95B9A|nr:hypothetical protein [Natronomonas marina]